MKRSIALVVTLSLSASALAAPPSPKKWTTGGKILTGGAVALGGYLLYRAYERHEERREAQINAIMSERNRGYSRYDENPGNAPDPYYPSSGSNAAYDSWAAAQSEAQQKAEAQREYDQQMATNAAKFRALTGTLNARIDALRSTQQPWACASLCGEYNGAELIAKLVDSTGQTAKEAQEAIGAKCTGKAYLFTSIAPAKKNYELNWNPGACFAAKTDTAKLVDEAIITANGMKARLVVTDVTIEPGDTPVTGAFTHAVLDNVQLLRTALGGGDLKSALEKAKKEGQAADPDFVKELGEIHPIMKLSRPGHIVMGNESPDSKKNITVVADAVGAGTAREVATIPFTIDHACGPETHAVKVYVVGLTGAALNNKSYKGSDHLLELYQDAFSSSSSGSGADSFCPASEDGHPAPKTAPPSASVAAASAASARGSQHALE